MLGLNEVFLDNVQVSDNQRLGKVHGGWQCMLSGLIFERIVTLAGYVGKA